MLEELDLKIGEKKEEGKHQDLPLTYFCSHPLGCSAKLC